MSDPPLHRRNGVPAVAFVPEPVQGLGREAKLDDEVAREVFGFCLPTFLATEAMQGVFVSGSALLRLGG